jgi:hypothetical protein
MGLLRCEGGPCFSLARHLVRSSALLSAGKLAISSSRAMDTDEFLRCRHFRSGQAKSQALSDLTGHSKREIFIFLLDPWDGALSRPIRLIDCHSKAEMGLGFQGTRDLHDIHANSASAGTASRWLPDQSARIEFVILSRHESIYGQWQSGSFVPSGR